MKYKWHQKFMLLGIEKMINKNGPIWYSILVGGCVG
jgi:hypothetical protein